MHGLDGAIAVLTACIPRTLVPGAAWPRYSSCNNRPVGSSCIHDLCRVWLPDRMNQGGCRRAWGAFVASPGFLS